ncbi:MAG: LysM peptidoglycan-binding domain-containing protein [Acidobacteriota bacterium]|nr:LysM peptidoglycan-binding domain-containing protein [Acidobacteriota bacterium]
MVSKNPDPVVVAPVSEVSPVAESPVKSPVDEIPQTDPIAPLIQRSRDLFKEGEKLFKDELFQEAREYFERALSNLKDSKFDLFLYPDLEKTYYDLLRNTQELELQIWTHPSQIESSLFVATPLEAMAGLDLFGIQVEPDKLQEIKEKVSQDLLNARFDIPIDLNDYVLRLLDYFQNKGRRVMEIGMRRSGKYMPLFRKIFQEENIPESLIYMAHVESNFRPAVYSRAGARGVWQFMPGTGRHYGLRQDWWIDERADIVKSTRAAARHLKDLYEELADWNLAMASYNAGIGRIQRNHRRYGPIDYWTMVKRRLLPRETRNYVPSILATMIIYHNPELYGFNVKRDDPLEFESVRVDDQVALEVVSKEINVSLDELAALNPELRRGVTPFGDVEYALKVPLGKGALLKERLAFLPPDKKAQFQHHKVRRGETLSGIAEGYSSTANAIMQVNRIRNKHRIREGQDLMIPLSSSFSAVGFPQARRQGPDNYVVRRGDSLSRIAFRYGVRVDDLLRWNSLTARGLIHPGQRIRILSTTESGRPGSARQAPDNYVVRRGDNPSKIASMYGVRVDDLLRWNSLNASSLIHPGQRIRIFSTTESEQSGSARQVPDHHVVRRGDSLSRIASMYGVRVDDLFRWNSLNASSLIHPGQRIRILSTTGSDSLEPASTGTSTQ